MKNSPKNKGFTLIELLVVVAIISLITSIVLGAIQDGRFRAQQTSHRQYLTEVAKAAELYRAEYNTLPGGSGIAPSVSDLTGSGGLFEEFIGQMPQPSYVLYPPTFSTLPALLNNWSCGGPNLNESYMIYFSSISSDLIFPKLYNGNNIYTSINGAYTTSWYCISDIT